MASNIPAVRLVVQRPQAARMVVEHAPEAAAAARCSVRPGSDTHDAASHSASAPHSKGGRQTRRDLQSDQDLGSRLSDDWKWAPNSPCAPQRRLRDAEATAAAMAELHVDRMRGNITDAPVVLESASVVAVVTSVVGKEVEHLTVAPSVQPADVVPVGLMRQHLVHPP